LLYIAVNGEEIIDFDKDSRGLVERLYKKILSRFVLYRYIMNEYK
jgi:hypothetical protein